MDRQIHFYKHSGIYTLEVSQELSMSLAEAWEFFSTPLNLQKITPKDMGFQITSKTAGKMHPGQIISYHVGIIPGIKTNWVTEITHVEKEQFFVDEQRYGPYSMWHHEHHFTQVGDKVVMRDKVSYRLPFPWLTNLFHGILIKPQLQKIFSYRLKVVDELFS